MNDGITIQRQVRLPFAKAAEFAWKSVRIRFWRSMITAGGVFLGIAFLASVLTAKAVAGDSAGASEIARGNWLVALSLVVCTVGITNSMLMSVSERFREIGTMKCLGALESFVVKIFMIEAGAMGAIASTCGWLVGTLMTLLAKRLVWNPKDPTALPHWYGSFDLSDLGLQFVLSLGVGTVLTVVATLFPAIQASRIPPAAALRTDV
ncbi:MAG: ABC transporter permease [Armatimonadota bacterium]